MPLDPPLTPPFQGGEQSARQERKLLPLKGGGWVGVRQIVQSAQNSKWLTTALLIAGLLLFGNGAYMKAKASLSQVLLAHAWERTLAGDTDGQALAFSPGLMHGSAAPGQPGLTLLAGHRDSHFAFLQYARPGDTLTLTGPDGMPHTYRLTETRLVDADASTLTPGGDGPATLALTTCYPFGALTPTNQRFVALATLDEGSTT